MTEDSDQGLTTVEGDLLDITIDTTTDLSSPLLSNGLRQRRNDDDEEGAQPRILDRDGTFHQSRGRWGVRRLSRRQQARRDCCCCLRRFWNEWILGDWFHRLAYQRTCFLMMILFLLYTAIVVFFAFIYLGVSILGQQTEVDPDGSKKVIAFCDMDINDHMEALYFSLSTMTTIGYGVSDYYFGGCWTPLLLVLWQVCSAITFDAVAVGLLFHRISRGRKRGKTILFSKKAVIRRIKGVPHFMFRIGELRRYHLIEATIRCYCVRHERHPVPATTMHTNFTATEERHSENRQAIETTHFISRQVNLLHPDENYGSHIWMGLPQVIVHRMDELSPLVPSHTWYDADGVARTYPSKTQSNSDPLSLASSLTHQDHGRVPTTPVLEMDGIEQFLLDRDSEIVVLVEGTDEGTGAATQARHSYKTTDLAWDHTFAQCVHPYTSQRPRRGDPACSIDFSRFHDIDPAPEDCDSCAYVPR